MHLNLLILCVVLSQAITDTISSENITESSDLLVRKKRVLDIENGHEELAGSGEFPYVVNILLEGAAHCVDSILSFYTVITSALCAAEHISSYKIAFGSVDLYRGQIRNVIRKNVRLGNHMRARASDGIALMFVDSSLTARYAIFAHLHVGPILPGLHATVPGWGCYFYNGVRGTAHPRKLRSITVPIMPHRECVNTYRGFYDINDEDVCIYDPHKRCGDTDYGAPLIIDGELAGVYLKRAENNNLRPAPEIFVLLQHVHYRQWIIDNNVH